MSVYFATGGRRISMPCIVCRQWASGEKKNTVGGKSGRVINRNLYLCLRLFWTRFIISFQCTVGLSIPVCYQLHVFSTHDPRLWCRTFLVRAYRTLITPNRISDRTANNEICLDFKQNNFQQQTQSNTHTCEQPRISLSIFFVWKFPFAQCFSHDSEYCVDQSKRDSNSAPRIKTRDGRKEEVI